VKRAALRWLRARLGWKLLLAHWVVGRLAVLAAVAVVPGLSIGGERRIGSRCSVPSSRSNAAPLRPQWSGVMPGPTATALESVRLAQVYNTVLRYVLDAAVDHGPLAGARRRLQFWLHDTPLPAAPLGTPAKARLLLQELGPTYVKVGQLVSSQSQVLPDDWAVELSRLQQDVATFPYSDVARIVTEDLGRPPEELFDRFDDAPLAAAVRCA
jgi:hypothetical protein